MFSLGSASAAAQSPEAESYYRDNIQSGDCVINVLTATSMVDEQGIRAFCSPELSCGQPRHSFNDFVNPAATRARFCNTVLEKIRGAALPRAWGWSQAVQKSSEYEKFEQYMELLTADYQSRRQHL